jgi:hypothetical protein
MLIQLLKKNLVPDHWKPITKIKTFFHKHRCDVVVLLLSSFPLGVGLIPRALSFSKGFFREFMGSIVAATCAAFSVTHPNRIQSVIMEYRKHIK